MAPLAQRRAARQRDPAPPRRLQISVRRAWSRGSGSWKTGIGRGSPTAPGDRRGPDPRHGDSEFHRRKGAPCCGCVRFHPLAFQLGKELLKAVFCSQRQILSAVIPALEVQLSCWARGRRGWGSRSGRRRSRLHPRGGGGPREWGLQRGGSSHRSWAAARLAGTPVRVLPRRPGSPPRIAPRPPARLFGAEGVRLR